MKTLYFNFLSVLVVTNQNITLWVYNHHDKRFISFNLGERRWKLKIKDKIVPNAIWEI